jgi:hypothetical protein
MDPSTREAIETGPTARSLELPRTAYTSGGTKLESVSCIYKPTKQKGKENKFIGTKKLKNNILTETHNRREVGKLSITDSLKGK